MTLGNYVARPMLNMFENLVARQVTCIKLPPTTNECHKIKASEKATSIQRRSISEYGRECGVRNGWGRRAERGAAEVAQTTTATASKATCCLKRTHTHSNTLAHTHTGSQIFLNAFHYKDKSQPT